MKYNGKTITKRTDGRYCARYTNETGKRVSIYGKTQNECIEKLKLSLKNMQKRKNQKEKEEVKKTQILLYDYLTFWNNTFKIPFNKTDNISRYIRLHILGKIENKPLTEVTTFDIQKCINEIPGCGKMRKEVQDVFNGAFRVAFANKLILDNPTLRLVKPKYNEQQGEALSEDEQTIFLEKLKSSPAKDILLLYIMTGARRNELMNITSKDIDFNNKILHLPGTKSAKSNRKIILCDTALEILKKLVKDNPNEKIIPFSGDYYTREFKKICPNHKLHDLRHTFGTRANENDVDMKVVQKLMGHSSYKITADTYTSVFSPTMYRETKKLNDYFDRVFTLITNENLTPILTPINKNKDE